MIEHPQAALAALERLRRRYIVMQEDKYLPPHLRDFEISQRDSKRMLREVNRLAKWLRENSTEANAHGPQEQL